MYILILQKQSSMGPWAPLSFQKLRQLWNVMVEHTNLESLCICAECNKQKPYFYSFHYGVSVYAWNCAWMRNFFFVNFRCINNGTADISYWWLDRWNSYKISIRSCNCIMWMNFIEFVGWMPCSPWCVDSILP